MGKKRRMVLIAGLVMGMTAGSMAAATLTGCKPRQETVIENVTGVYYGEADGKECEVRLDGSSDGTFSFSFNGNAKQGEFTYDGTNLNLRFADDTIVVANLTKSGENDSFVIRINYDGTDFNLVVVNKYEVSFKDGDTVIRTESVVEGKTVKKPSTPTKTNYAFVGWYEDSALKTPFDFSKKTITGATTVYARYEAVDASKSVYEVKFYDGDKEVASAVQTVNGVVYELPTLTKSGSTFAGWWMSDYEDANKLTCKYEGQELKQNTTLFAVWESSAPLVSVTSTGIKWSAKGVNNSYDVTVTLPDGTEDRLGNQSITSLTYDFSLSGDYIISVTLRGQTTKIYLNNKGLARVSNISVDGNVLKFEGVEGAERYALKIDCGNSAHNHEQEVDLGNKTEYDFSSCGMKAEGITFIVKAYADGSASSSSAPYNLERHLDAVKNIAVDDTDTLKWDGVDKAVSYVVKIKSGENTQEYRVSNTEVAAGLFIGEYSGELEISVCPVAFGYNSPAETELKFTKPRLSIPTNIKNDDYKVSWDAVAGATGYIVKIGDSEIDVTGTEYTLTDEQFMDGVATVYVCAKGATEKNNSVFGRPCVINKGFMSPVYNKGQVSWGATFGAKYYEVKVNDGEPFRVDALSSAVTLTQKGENVISVRFNDGKKTSDWFDVSVTAYEVTVEISANFTQTVYKAAGDNFDLEDAERQGYTFTGWYIKDGAKFEDTVFSASDLALTASFVANRYTVTLKLDNGEVFDTKEVTFDEEFALAVPESTDPTKTFGGWRLEAGGQGTQYTDPEGFGSREWNIDSDTNLFVSWLDVFKFTLSQNGKEYSVEKGAGIRYVTSVKVPAYYGEGENRLPVTTIGSGAFQSCNNLKSVSIPNTMQIVAIGVNGGNGTGSAFSGCTSIEAVTVYEVEGFNAAASLYSSEDGVLIYKNERDHNVQILYYPYAKQGKFTIPDYVTNIPVKAFSSTQISEVEIPSSVTSIDKEAFYSCKQLSKITFLPPKEEETPASLTIGSGAFKSCIMSDVKFPSRLVGFEMDLFDSCPNLISLDVEAGGDFSSDDGVLIKTINKVKTVYYCPRNRVENYVISTPEIKEIGERAFYNCKSISEVVIPEWVTKIGKEAFRGCEGVTTLTFNGVETSGDLTICEAAFYGCKGIGESLVLPENLTTIEKNAFGGISSLTHVTMNCARDREKISYANSAFATTSSSGTGTTYVTDLTLGEKVGEFDINGVFGSTSLQAIHVDPNNANFADDSGVLYNKDYTSILYYPNGKEGEFTIRDTVAKIGASVFEGKANITTITIGKNVTEIGERAFAKCENLTSLTFVDDTTADFKTLDLKKGAFNGCTGLTELDLPTRLRTIGDEAFMGVENVENIVIPEGVTTIGHRAFGMLTFNSVLKTFKISSTVTSIAEFDTSGTDHQLYKNSNVFYYNTDRKTPYKNGNIDIFFVSYSKSSGYIFRGNKFEKFIVDKNNANYGSKDGVLYKKTDGKLTKVLMSPMANDGDNDDGIITVPDTVTSVSDMAFGSAMNAKKIIFDDTTAHDLDLGTASFNGAWLSKVSTEVSLPNGMTKIAPSAFYNSSSHTGGTYTYNSGVTKLNIPNTVTEIGEGAFTVCSGLEELIFDKGNDTTPLTIGATSSTNAIFSSSIYLTKLELPERIVIGDYAFYGLSGLQSLKIPASVKSIGVSAFEGCSKITSLSFGDKDNASQLTTINNKAFKGLSKLNSLALPLTLETIGDYAFQNCYDLGSVTIPAKVKSIGLQAFGSCTTLNSLEFSEGSALTSIGNSAFTGANLTALDLSNCTQLATIGDSAFSSNKLLGSVDIPATVTSLGANAFSSCTSLASVTFKVDSTSKKSAIESIGANCFKETALTAFVFPESTTSKPEGITLGANMFNGCKELTTITLSPSVKNIDGVFAQCYSIEEIIIPDGNTSIKTDKNAPLILGFDGKSVKYAYQAIPTQAGTYTLPEGITEISPSAFKNQQGIEKLVLPTSLVNIGNNAFQNCYSLKEVVVPDDANLELIGMYAFENCFSLENISFGKKLKYIKVSAFKSCTKLGAITLPNTLEGLGNYAFQNSGVTSVNIPASLKYTVVYIKNKEVDNDKSYQGGSVFENCTKLTSVTLTEGLTWLGQYMFENTAITEITIPSSVNKMEGYYTFKNCLKLETANIKYSLEGLDTSSSYSPNDKGMFDGCTALETVNFDENVTVLPMGTFNGCTALKSIDLTGITTFGEGVFTGCTALSSVTLDSGLTTLSKQMFKGCTSLKSITLPDSITFMNVNTFENSGLTSITLPNGVTMLGKTATAAAAGDDVSLFKGCESLTEVILNAGLTKMGASVFLNCTSLTTVKYIGSDGKTVGENGKITLPAGLTSIGNTTFSNTGFTDVTLPATVTTIGTGLFQGCTKLTSATVAKLNSNMFESCESLGTVTLNDAITAISGSAFLSCSALTTVKTYAADGTITGDDGKVTLPSKLTGTTGIGSSSFKGTAVAEITIPNNVTKIGDTAFQNCLSLTKITLGSKTATLGKQTFDGCTNLQQVNGEGLTTIGQKAFLNCTSLDTINLSKVATGNTYMFQNCSSLKSVDLSKLKTIGSYAFDGCSELSTVTLNPAATKIDTYAFRGCAITSITLPATLTSIGNYAFQNSALTSVTIPSKVTSISTSAFEGCDKLASVTFEGNVTTIGGSAFNGCSSLQSISLPATVTSLGDSAFKGCSNLLSIDLPANVTTLGNGAFNGCKALSNITLPATLTTIKANCFLNCSSLTQITLPASVVSLGVNAFDSSTQVIVDESNSVYFSEQDAVVDENGKLLVLPGSLSGELVIPEGVTGIAGWVFNGRNDITSVKLPASLTSIDAEAFVYFKGTLDFSAVTQLTSISSKTFKNYRGTSLTLPDSVTEIGTNAFEGSSIESINLPQHIESIGDSAFLNCASLASIVIPEGVTALNKGLFMGCTALANVKLPSTLQTVKSSSSSYYIFEGCAITEFVFPAGVTEIGYCFKNCLSLAKITLPAGLTSAGSTVFSGCTAINEVILPEGLAYVPNLAGTKIKSANIPSTVTTVYSGAFSGCEELTSVSLPEGLTDIVSSMFKGCVKLTEITIPSTVTSIGANAFEGSGITQITLPAGLTSIGDKAFLSTGITQISLPVGLTTIGASAFSGLPLTAIEIPSTVTSVGNSAFKDCEQLATITINEGEEAMVFGTSVFANTAVKSVSLHAKMAISATKNGINESMFMDCSQLQTVTLAEGIEEIEDKVFANCTSIQSITIPASVRILNSSVFSGWTNEQRVTINRDAYDDAVWLASWYNGSAATYVIACNNPVNAQPVEDKSDSEG